MKKKSYSVVEVKDKAVREYLMKNYSGSQLYIRVGNETKSKSRKDMVKILLKAGVSERDICKGLRMFPSTIRKMAGISMIKKYQTVEV